MKKVDLLSRIEQLGKELDQEENNYLLDEINAKYYWISVINLLLEYINDAKVDEAIEALSL